jgi:hypothetical protein
VVLSSQEPTIFESNVPSSARSDPPTVDDGDDDDDDDDDDDACVDATAALIAATKGDQFSVTILRAPTDNQDDISCSSAWQIVYNDIPYYNVQNEPEFAGCRNLPYIQSPWTTDNTVVAASDYPMATVTAAPCDDNPALTCIPLDFDPDESEFKPANTCPRVYCITNADPLVVGEYWEDIDIQMSDNVPRYIKREADYTGLNQCLDDTDPNPGTLLIQNWELMTVGEPDEGKPYGKVNSIEPFTGTSLYSASLPLSPSLSL